VWVRIDSSGDIRMEAQDLNSAPDLPDEYEFGIRVDAKDREALLTALGATNDDDAAVLTGLAQRFGRRSSAVEDFKELLTQHGIADHFWVYS
jgi:hypothetical protein